MSSQELVLSPDFISLLSDAEGCKAEDFLVLAESVDGSELAENLDDFYSEIESLTARLEALDEDLITDCGEYIQKRLDQLTVDYNELDSIVSSIGRYDTLIRDSYFPTYALALAEEQVDSQMPTGWPFDCMALDREEVVTTLQHDYIVIEILGTVYWYEG